MLIRTILDNPTFGAAIESIATRPLVEWAASFAARIETQDAVQLCNLPTRPLVEWAASFAARIET